MRGERESVIKCEKSVIYHVFHKSTLKLEKVDLSVSHFFTDQKVEYLVLNWLVSLRRDICLYDSLRYTS